MAMRGDSILQSAHRPVPYRNLQISRLKLLIWSYFWLLIFEGAIRKWIPALSNVFLLVRDPIALLIWIDGARLRVADVRFWWLFCAFAFPVTLLGLLQVMVLSVPFPIFLFGWRSYVLHLPVIFVAGSVLNAQDLRKLGRWILITAIPMTVLMLLQYGAPPDAWLNRGATADGGQLPSALGHIRPAGTFSFITGPAAFIPVAGAFVLLGLTDRRFVPRWLAVCAGVSLLVVVPFSGSRTLALEVAALLFLVFLGASIRGTIVFKPAQVPKIAMGIVAAMFIVAELSRIPLVQEGLETFTTRWTGANESEGGAASAIEDRGFGGFGRVFQDVADAPFLGIGIGSGSNFASAYRTGFADFSLGEGSWEREINELGSITGLIFIVCRSLAAVVCVIVCFQAVQQGALLPWYLLAGSLNSLLNGLLDQTTAQGFLIFTMMLILAGLRTENRSFGYLSKSHPA